MLRGAVCAVWGEHSLTAPQLLWNRKSGVATLEQGLLWSSDEAWLKARFGQLRPAQGEGRLEEVEYALPSLAVRGSAAHLRKSGALLRLQQARYSSCPMGDDSWRVSAGRLILDTERELGTVHNARLYIGPLPVLYLPYWHFPLGGRRRSGFLAPQYGRAGDGALVLGAPFYLNLAPNYDATLTPYYHEGRGALLEAELRHLRQSGQRTVRAAWMPDDDRAAGQQRWLLHWNEARRWGDAWGLRVDYRAASDERYLLDLYGDSLESKNSTYLRRYGELSYHQERLQARLQLRSYQYLAAAAQEEESYRLLPQLRWSWQPLRAGAWRGTLEGHYSRFSHPELPQGARLYLEPRLGRGWFGDRLRLQLALRHRSYRLQEAVSEVRAGGPDAVQDMRGEDATAGDKRPSYTTPTVSLDWRYPLERRVRWAGGDYRQLLTPRAYYLFAKHRRQEDAPDFDTRPLVLRYAYLFRENRFAGYDRAGDANQLALALEGELRDSRDRTLAALRAGGLLYFRDREVTLGDADATAHHSSSPLAGQLLLNLGGGWSANADALWDARRDRMLVGGTQLRYRAGRDRAVQLRYRYRHPSAQSDLGLADGSSLFGGTAGADDEAARQALPVEQLELGVVWRAPAHWRWIARWQYDLEGRRRLEDTLGIEYNSCCWGVRFLYQRGRSSVDGIRHEYMLEFSLRGLGGSARRIEEVLGNTLEGFLPQ